MKLKATCDGLHCRNKPSARLIDATQEDHYCASCFKEAVGDVVFDNDEVSFVWDEQGTTCTIVMRGQV